MNLLGGEGVIRAAGLRIVKNETKYLREILNKLINKSK